MLIDTRDDRPPEPHGPSAADRVFWVLEHLFPWPAVIAWLFVASVVLTEVPGMLCALALLYVVFWRGLRWSLNAGGLRDYHQ